LAEQSLAARLVANCSFDGSTLVKTDEGFTAIRDVQPGLQLVWSQDERGHAAYKPVLARLSRHHDRTLYLTLASKKDGQSQTIVTTLNHPFFAVARAAIPNASVHNASLREAPAYAGPIGGGAWIAAGDLRPGDRLLGADGGWNDVTGLRVEANSLDAYNLTVADFHTYFVKQAANDNAEPVWVHNACQLTFGADGRKLDFLFNKNIDSSNPYNVARAAGNASRIGIADTPENRNAVIQLFNNAYNNPASIVGVGAIPGSNLREFFLPGVTGTGSIIQFVELNGRVITIIAK
jgi:hypothetical protein